MPHYQSYIASTHLKHTQQTISKPLENKKYTQSFPWKHIRTQNSSHRIPQPLLAIKRNHKAKLHAALYNGICLNKYITKCIRYIYRLNTQRYLLPYIKTTTKKRYIQSTYLLKASQVKVKWIKTITRKTVQILKYFKKVIKLYTISTNFSTPNRHFAMKHTILTKTA